MKRYHHIAAALGAVAGLGMLAGSAMAQSTWTVAESGGDFETIQAAIAAAEDGDTIQIAPGTFTWTGQLNVNKSLTIVGAGVDETTIGRAENATSNSVESMRVTAPDVTIEGLTFLPFAGYPNGGQGYAINVNQPNFTVRNVTTEADGIRSWIIGGANNVGMVLDNTQWLGACSNQGFRNGFNEFTIQNSVFDFNQYLGGALILGSADPLQGVIRDNYFLVGAGGPWPTPRFSDSEFTPSGEDIHVINLQQRAGGLVIANNTFVHPSANVQNGSGNFPQTNAIRLTPSLGAAPGDLTIKDNIFVGYEFMGDLPEGPTGVLPSFESVSDPSRTWSTGALNFDGISSAAYFEDNDFDIGARGTISFWVNLRTIGKRHMIWEGPGNGGMEVQFRDNQGGQWYGSPNGAGLTTNERYAIQTGGHTVTDVWTNIQVTWDVDLQEMRVFHNGVEHGYIAGSGSDISGAGWDSSTVLNTAFGRHFIGMDPGSPDRVLSGLLDDLAFFSEALNETERNSVRTNGAAGADLASLVVHWDFNTDPGDDTAIMSTGGLPINLQLTSQFDVNNFDFVPGAVVVPENTLVDYNLFFENSNAANVALGANNIIDQDPRFVGEGDAPEDLYRLQTNSPAVGADTQGDNIGANQLDPIGPPALVGSRDLVVPIGGYRIINDRFLNATSSEPTITYNVVSGPEFGTLSATTFTQDDLADRAVSYRHDGSENFEDSFTFTLSDGSATSDELTLDIIVLDLSQPDTDYDGLPDYFEELIGTDPNSRDTSGDGFEDGVLVAVGLDPLADNSALTNVRGLPDTDLPASSDGTPISAFYQVALGTDPTDADDIPALGDVDANGVVDIADALTVFRLFLGVVQPEEGQLDRANITRARTSAGDPVATNLGGTLLINALLGNIEGVPIPD